MPRAEVLRLTPAVAPGTPRGSLFATTRCLLESFSEAWLCSPSSLETVCCTGTGGCCEAVAESDGLASRPAGNHRHCGLRARRSRDPPHAQEYGRRHGLLCAVSSLRR